MVFISDNSKLPSQGELASKSINKKFALSSNHFVIFLNFRSYYLKILNNSCCYNIH